MLHSDFLVLSLTNNNETVFSMMYVCGNGRDGHGYPMEKVNWTAMGESDQSNWLSSGIVPQENAELVRLGIFGG